MPKYLALWKKQQHKAIPQRSLSTSVVKKYGVVVTDTHHAYPYYNDDGVEPIGFKIRRVADKHIYSVGEMSEGNLFGQQRFGNHGQTRVVLVEGELDALSASAMFDDKVAVVSIKGAASAGRDCKKAFQFLDGFKEVVVCFDADAAGQAAVAQVAEVFAGKLRIMTLDPRDGKDASDYLVSGKKEEFTKLYWSAPLYVPDGVLSVDDMRTLLMKEEPDKLATWPWPELNAMTEGMRPTELVMMTAGSGLGKSSVLREAVMHIRQTSDVKIGCLFMEESPKRTIEGFMSIDLSTPLHLEGRAVQRDSKEYWDSFDRVYGGDNLYVMDASFDTGATVDAVVSRVRFMAKALDCKVIILDHISILVSGGQHGDERKALDEIMTKLRTLTQDTGIVLLAVSHLKRPDGKGHEEGAVTSVAQLRGSASIAQLSDFVIGLERNGQADDPEERNTTHIRVLKNRHSGITGPAGALLYDPLTGRLSAHTPPEEEAL
jgi:twinkle protein